MIDGCLLLDQIQRERRAEVRCKPGAELALLRRVRVVMSGVMMVVMVQIQQFCHHGGRDAVAAELHGPAGAHRRGHVPRGHEHAGNQREAGEREKDGA